eukprot:m.58662 g.58662  ORF g.58662 m.58662 type:complete len:782 (+) comp7875_c1_seq1:882-3227(+)
MKERGIMMLVVGIVMGVLVSTLLHSVFSTQNYTSFEKLSNQCEPCICKKSDVAEINSVVTKPLPTINNIDVVEKDPPKNEEATTRVDVKSTHKVDLNSVEPKLRNFVTSHFWANMCGFSIQEFKNHPHFPNKPHHIGTLEKLETRYFTEDYGQRLIGYIHPSQDGKYKFSASAGGCVEMHLSTDSHHDNAEIILETCEKGSNPKTPVNEFTIMSKEFTLHAGKKYYFELLHKMGEGADRLQVAWSLNGGSMEVIRKEFLSAFEDVKVSHFLGREDDEWQLGHIHKQEYVTDPMIQPFTIPTYYPDEGLKQVLPSCSWQPSYAHPRQVRLYEAANKYICKESAVYPNDHTLIEGSKKGNEIIDEFFAKSTAKRYLESVNAWRLEHDLNELKLLKIVHMEAKRDGSMRRVLVELDVDDGGKKMRISRYVIVKDDNSLCDAANFQWRKKAMVHIIIPVQNQGAWVKHLVENLERLYEETKDDNFNLILTDFGSTDIDTQALLENSKLKRFQVFNLDGPFSRSIGIQKGLDSVKNPDDIIFTCDLHLEIPPILVEDIRKHCIKGKTGYNPVVVRLDCGSFQDNPTGTWELIGYGLFGLYKSDFDYIGGMNTKKFTYNWGGEDWDMLDRVYGKGLECERLRVYGFYHFFHSKKSLWGKRNLLTEKLALPFQFHFSPNAQIKLSSCDNDNGFWFYGAAGALRPTVQRKYLLTYDNSRGFHFVESEDAPKAGQHFLFEHDGVKEKFTNQCWVVKGSSVSLGNCLDRAKIKYEDGKLKVSNGQCIGIVS